MNRGVIVCGAVLLLAVPALGARADELPPMAVDLVARFPVADVQAETGTIRFGDPAASDLLGDGWSGSSKDSGVVRFRWGTGEHSNVRFFVTEPHDLNVSFRCWPLRARDMPPQRVAVAANGQAVGEVTLSPLPSRYSVRVPATLLRAGENRLTFQYAWSRKPSDLSPASHDQRPLAAAWEWLDFGNGRQKPQPRVEREGDNASIILPSGTQIDYYVEVAPGSVLTFADVIPPSGNDAGALQINFQTDGTPPRRLELIRPQSGHQRTIPLPASAPTMARISFRATGDSSQAAAGWRLVRPAVRSPSAASAAQSPHDSARLPWHAQPNIIIYLIDTLRADHLGCYGYTERPTSPHIDDFASHATLFTRMSAQSSHTRPSVATIFTGLDPRVHQVQDGHDALPESAVTIAEILQNAGYETAGVVTNGNVASELGFGQGFASYQMLAKDPEGNLPTSAQVNALAFEWLEHRRTDRPFFLYLHSVDPHQPYVPLSPYRERFAAGVDIARVGFVKDHVTTLSAADRVDAMRLYDAEIAGNDANFGALLDKLRALGLYDRTLIVLMADHGEEFYDHGGWLHGKTLYGELLHVPLAIKFPDGVGAGLRVDQQAQQIDILPTVIAAAGQETLPPLHGRNLIPLWSVSAGPQPPTFAAREPTRFALESVTFNDLKLIHNRYGRAPEIELYDLRADPQEQHNLAAERPVADGYLRTLLRLTQPADGERLPRAQGTLNSETKERLRALGYSP